MDQTPVAHPEQFRPDLSGSKGECSLRVNRVDGFGRRYKDAPYVRWQFDPKPPASSCRAQRGTATPSASRLQPRAQVAGLLRLSGFCSDGAWLILSGGSKNLSPRSVGDGAWLILSGTNFCSPVSVGTHGVWREHSPSGNPGSIRGAQEIGDTQ